MRAVAQIAQSVEQGIENPRVGGSIPSLGTNYNSSLVQSVERRTVNPYVTGSSPVGGAKFLTISVQVIHFSALSCQF